MCMSVLCVLVPVFAGVWHVFDFVCAVFGMGEHVPAFALSLCLSRSHTHEHIVSATC